MKTVIKGLEYNTEKAEELGRYGNGKHPSDEHYCLEVLYLKRTGEFFLYGRGGFRSKYAQQKNVRDWVAGERITPLTHKKAHEWGKKYLDKDTYDAVFGEVSEDLSLDRLNVRIPRHLLEQLKKDSRRLEISLKDYVTGLLEDALR